MSGLLPTDPTDTPAPVVLSYGRHAPADPPPLEPSANLDTVDSKTRHYRHDGWTPAARAAFLDVLAKSGVVTDACREVQRSSQAAYALRNRDPLFAAGWEAALTMARARLADDLFHRAVHGTYDQIWKDGVVIAERHRHDNRLSIAVLNRLDARCDRAQRLAEPAIRAAANWDAYLSALAEDRTVDLEAMLAAPPPASFDEDEDAYDDDAILGRGSDAMLIRQLHQLGAGKALDEGEEEEEDDGDDEPRVWIEDHSWRTDYPPPAGFNGYEDGTYGDLDYSRQCTPEERELLDRCYPDAIVDEAAEQLQADETERDSFFSGMAQELATNGEAPDEPAQPPAEPPAAEAPPPDDVG
jgi:hypothetical protein